MHDRSTRLLVLPALLLALLALGAKGPPKLDRFQAFAQELEAAGELSDDAWKVLKHGDRCLAQDRTWEASMQSERETPVNEIYELMSSAVVCWQGAEKKATKIHDQLEPVAAWIAARARYVETMRSFVWALDAKLSGDKVATCKRVTTAAEASEVANQAASGMGDRFQLPDAKRLGMEIDAYSKQLGQQIADELLHQKCS